MIYKKDILGDDSDIICKKLRSLTKNNYIKLPKYISFKIDNNTLEVYLQEQSNCENKVVEIMQDDNATFEGWSVVLKAWLKEIEIVVLKWDIPSKMVLKEETHYNRFLYRVIRMLDSYSWFKIDASLINEVENFKNGLTDLEINFGTKGPEKKLKHGGEYGENAVEYDMVHSLKKNMCDHYDIEVINHQLPVGIKKAGEQFLSGYQAAIDIYGYKANEFTLIELKYKKNNKVGIISELFLYTQIIKDLIRGVISTPKVKGSRNNDFFSICKDIKTIHARMLADTFHPLLMNQAVFDILNNCKQDDILIDYNKSSYIFSISPETLIFI